MRWGVAGPGPVADKVLRDLAHVGVYPVSFAQMLLGAPQAVVAHGVVHESGADVEESVLLRYPGGRSALLLAGLEQQRNAQWR